MRLKRYHGWRYLGVDDRAVYFTAQRQQADLGIAWPVVVEVFWQVAVARHKADQLARRVGPNAGAVLLDYLEVAEVRDESPFLAMPEPVRERVLIELKQHFESDEPCFGLLVVRYLDGRPLIQKTSWRPCGQTRWDRPECIVFPTVDGEGVWVQTLVVPLTEPARLDLLIQMADQVRDYHATGQYYGGLMSPSVLYDDNGGQLRLASRQWHSASQPVTAGQAVDMRDLGRWLARLLPGQRPKPIRQLMQDCAGPANDQPTCWQFLRELKSVGRQAAMRQALWPVLAGVLLLVSAWVMRHLVTTTSADGLVRLTDDSKTYQTLPRAGIAGEEQGNERHRVLAIRPEPTQRILKRRAPTLYERDSAAMMMAQINRMRGAPVLDLIENPRDVAFVLMRGHRAWVWVNDHWHGLGSFWKEQIFWSRLNVEVWGSKSHLYAWLRHYDDGADRILGLGEFQRKSLRDGILFHRIHPEKPWPAPVLSLVRDHVVYDFDGLRRKRHLANPFVPQAVGVDAALSHAADSPMPPLATEPFALASLRALFSREGHWWLVNAHTSRSPGQWLDLDRLLVSVEYVDLDEIHFRFHAFDRWAVLPLQRQSSTVVWPKSAAFESGEDGMWFKFDDDQATLVTEATLLVSGQSDIRVDSAPLAQRVIHDPRFSISERRRAAAFLAKQLQFMEQPIAPADLHITVAEHMLGHWLLRDASGRQWGLGDWLNEDYFLVAVIPRASSKDLQAVMGQLGTTQLTTQSLGSFQTLRVDDKTTRYRRVAEDL